MITPVNNTNPSFKRVDVIHMPKKLFGNQSYLEIEKSIEKTLIEQLPFKEKMKAKVSNYLKKGAPAYEMFLESPGYSYLMDELKKAGGYSLNWLSAHTGVEVQKPVKEGFHTLFLITGRDLDNFRKCMGLYHKVMPKVLHDSFEKRYSETGVVPDLLWTRAFTYEALTQCFKLSTFPVVLRKFINHPDEFKQCVKDIFTPKTM